MGFPWVWVEQEWTDVVATVLRRVCRFLEVSGLAETTGKQRPHLVLPRRGFDFIGNDIPSQQPPYNQPRLGNSGSQTTAAECQSLCTAEPLCAFFTFNSNSNVDFGCWLKTSDAGRTASAGATSGPRSCCKDDDAAIQKMMGQTCADAAQ
eukprot:gene14983-biopygen6630